MSVKEWIAEHKKGVAIAVIVVIVAVIIMGSPGVFKFSGMKNKHGVAGDEMTNPPPKYKGVAGDEGLTAAQKKAVVSKVGARRF